MSTFDQLIAWIDKITILITLVFTVWNWHSNRKWNKKLEEDIKIELYNKQNDETYILPHTIRRRHFTRSEIQGLLGNYNGVGRYEIAYMASEDYPKAIDRVQNGDTNKLIVYVDADDKFSAFPPKAENAVGSTVNS